MDIDYKIEVRSVLQQACDELNYACNIFKENKVKEVNKIRQNTKKSIKKG